MTEDRSPAIHKRKPSEAAALERIKKYVDEKFPAAAPSKTFRGRKTRASVYIYTTQERIQRCILTSVSQDGNQTAIHKDIVALIQEGDMMIFALKECANAVFVADFSANVLDSMKRADTDRRKDRYHHLDVKQLADREKPRSVFVRCSGGAKIAVAVQEVPML